MKKIITLSLFVFCVTSLLAQKRISVLMRNPQAAVELNAPHQNETARAKTIVYLKDSSVLWTYTTNWDKTSRNVFTYDANGNMLTQMNQSYAGGVYTNVSLTTKTYDAHNNNTTYIYQTWSSGAWVNSSQYIYTYDANNNLINSLYQTWISGAWVNSSQLISTFNANNSLLTEVVENWNGASWDKTDSTTFYYTGSLRTGVLYQSWNATNWVSTNQLVFTYNANNYMTVYLNQTWSGSAWVNNYQYLFTYNLNNRTTIYEQQSWNGTAWVNSFQDLYTYDANNNRILLDYQTWNATTWDNNTQDKYEFDANNNQTSDLNQTWNGNSFDNSDSTHNYYRQANVTGIANEENVIQQLTIFPNPANQSAVIRLQSSVNTATIKLINPTGQTVMEKQNQSGNQFNIDLSTQPSGIYFVEVQQAGNVWRSKIVKAAK